MRILLVEDDRKAARLLARGFREEGFVVDVVASAGRIEAFNGAEQGATFALRLPRVAGLETGES